MSYTSSPTKPILGFLVIIFLSQFAFSSTGHTSNLFLSLLDVPIVDMVLDILAKVVCWLVVPVFVVHFFFQTFIVRPNYIQNASNIIYLALSVYLVQLGQLFLGEYKPHMLAAIANDNVFPHFCDAGFGIPSGYIFMSVVFFHLYRRNFFVEGSDKPYPRFLNENSSDFMIDRLTDDDSQHNSMLTFGDCKHKIMGQTFSLTKFKKMSYVILVLVCLSRFLLASNFVLQIVFSLLVAAWWSRVYYGFCEAPIKGLVHDLVRVPSTRIR